MRRFKLFGRELVFDWVPLLNSFLTGVSWACGVATGVGILLVAFTLYQRLF